MLIPSTAGPKADDLISIVKYLIAPRMSTGTNITETRRNLLPYGFQLRQVLSSKPSVKCAAMSPDGRYIAQGAADGFVYVWNCRTGETERLHEAHDQPVLSIAWSLDGRMLVTGTEYDGPCLWPALGLEFGHRYRREFGVTATAWAPDNRFASASRDAKIHIWASGHPEPLCTLAGHSGLVRALAWSAGDQLLSGSDDGTVRLWDVARGICVHVFSGHSGEITSVAFLREGIAAAGIDKNLRLWDFDRDLPRHVLEGHSSSVTSLLRSDNETLFSAGAAGEIWVWNTSDGTLLHSIPGPQEHSVCLSVALINSSAPEVTRLPSERSSGSPHIFIRSWKTLLPRAIRQSHGSHAKVVLVGDSGVGKSGLALRLAQNRFEHTDTTQGMRIWRVSAEQLAGEVVSDGFGREVFIWDLGGQSEYRLIHQLFLHDTVLAVFLFHPTRGERAFSDIVDWNQRFEKQLGNRTATKLLVRSQTDLERGLVDMRSVNDLQSKCGFLSYHEVSAKDCSGIAAFRRALTSNLEWQRTTRPYLFQWVREKVIEAREDGLLAIYCEALHREARDTLSDDYDSAAMDQVVGQLAQQGLVARLRVAAGDEILILKVEEIERYGGAVVLAARDNPRGIPVIEQRRLLSPEMAFPGIEPSQRLPRPDERLVIESVTQLLVDKNLCLLHEGLLVFPHLFRLGVPNEQLDVTQQVSIHYDFSGAIDNIYDSLVVRLALSKEFGECRMWENQAEYMLTHSGALYGIKRLGITGGMAQLDLYFNDKTTSSLRDLFVTAIEEHLRKQGIGVRERLHTIFECGFEFSESFLRARLLSGHHLVMCPSCEERHQILTGGGNSIRARDPGLDDRILALRTKVDAKTKLSVEQLRLESGRIPEHSASLPSSQTIRILHLSDLHLRSSDSHRALLQPLIADLRQQLSVFRLHYLVVSGDFVHRCDDGGFAVASRFLSELCSAMGLSAERCVIVPGNHDLKHELTSFNLSSTDGPDAISQGSVYLLPDKEGYPRRFRLFANMFKEFTLLDFPLEASNQIVLLPFEDTRIQFLGLNSAWNIDQFRPNRSSIHPDALAKGLDAASQYEGFLGIAVWHHAITGNNKIRDTAFVGRLAQANFRICLHGDVHEFRPDTANPYGPEPLHIVGGGSFSARYEDRPESVPRMYNLIEIQPDLSSARVRTRKQEVRDKEFSANAVWRVSGSADMMRADYEFNLLN